MASSSILQDEMPPPTPDEAGGPVTRFRPYASTKHTATRARYVTSSDPRGYIPVYEYPFNGQWLMVDSDTGYVLWTGIWKALGNIKTDIVKMVEMQPELAPQLKRIRGGYLKIQGTWMPYEIALRLARKVAWPIRDDLVPLFGPTFPSTCITPDQPGYGLLGNNTGRRRRGRTALSVTMPVPTGASAAAQRRHQQQESTLRTEQAPPTSTAQGGAQRGHHAVPPFFGPTMQIGAYPPAAAAPEAPSASGEIMHHSLLLGFPTEEYRNTPSYPQQFDRKTDLVMVDIAGQEHTQEQHDDEHQHQHRYQQHQHRHQHRHRYAPYPGVHEPGHGHAHAHGQPHGLQDAGFPSFSADPYRTRDGLIHLPPLPSLGPPLPPLGPPLPSLGPPMHTPFSNAPPTDRILAHGHPASNAHGYAYNTNTPPPPPPSASPYALPPISSLDRDSPGAGGDPDGNSSAVLRRLRLDDSHVHAERWELDRDARVATGIHRPSYSETAFAMPSPHEQRRTRSISGPSGNAYASGSSNTLDAGNMLLHYANSPSREVDADRGSGGSSSVYPPHLARSSHPRVDILGGSGASSSSAPYACHDDHRDYAPHGHVYSLYEREREQAYAHAGFEAQSHPSPHYSYPDGHFIRRDQKRSSPDSGPIAGPSGSRPGPSYAYSNDLATCASGSGSTSRKDASMPSRPW